MVLSDHSGVCSILTPHTMKWKCGIIQWQIFCSWGNLQKPRGLILLCHNSTVIQILNAAYTLRENCQMKVSLLWDSNLTNHWRRTEMFLQNQCLFPSLSAGLCSKMHQELWTRALASRLFIDRTAASCQTRTCSNCWLTSESMFPLSLQDITRTDLKHLTVSISVFQQSRENGQTPRALRELRCNYWLRGPGCNK